MVAAATAVRADLAQTAADAYALELDGLATPHLRLISVVRAAFILLTGVPLGVLGGLLLTTVAVRLLVTGPGGAAVEPPLRVVFGALPTCWSSRPRRWAAFSPPAWRRGPRCVARCRTSRRST